MTDGFSLLAGHLAWPLRRALQRREFTAIERAFADEIWQLRSETREERLFDALRHTLEKLGYPRGMISKVDFVERNVVGVFCWGGEKMESVRGLTQRDLDRDSNDCQILAVRQRKSQNITNPQKKGAGADQLAVVEGDLKPFMIYPILDNHGRPTWTLHIERRDGASLGNTDERRIRSLCNRIMKAREESRRTQFEHTWYQEMLRTSFYSFEDLLCRFADSVVSNRIVVRCRIFLVDDSGRQQPLYQAGALQTPKFSEVEIGERDIDIRNETVPVLCVRKRFSSQISDGDGSEFKILKNHDDPHLEELDNEHRSQWVEAPVKFESKTVAKLLFDHSIVPGGDCEFTLGKDDAFTLGELRLIGRLTRILGIAAEVAEAYRVIAGLCCAGIHGKLIWHFFESSTSTLFKIRDLPDLVAQEVEKIRECLEAFRGVLGKKSTDRETGAVPIDPPTVGDELTAAIRAIRPITSGIELPTIDPANFPQTVATSDHSLFLTLVTLLENCVKYIRKADGGPRGKINIRVVIADCRARISVEDNGIGVETRKAEELSEMFRDPAKFLPWDNEELGLAYLAFLAKENKWELKLVQRENPTTFELVITTQEAGEQK